MAQKGLAVNQVTTPPDGFISSGLDMLPIGNTDLRDKGSGNNQLKRASQPARKRKARTSSRETQVLHEGLVKNISVDHML